MSKHRLLHPSDPPAKRLHLLSDDTSSERPHTGFGTLLYDELILCIFSHLSWIDLCRVQSTNKEWARLATDNELWRRLFLRVFGRPRLRGSRGFIGRADGLEIKSLPGRAEPVESKDWKHMFRISSNWQRGRCKTEQQVYGQADDKHGMHTHHIHILIAGSITIMASAKPALRPRVHLHRASREVQVIECPTSHPDDGVHITALAIDQSPPHPRHFRLASFLSSGEYAIYTVHHTQPNTITECLRYIPSRKSSRTSPIIQAVYHHPLLVTLSQSFSLSFYDVSDKITHTQTMSSFTSFPPTSLVLSALSPSLYKLVLAYAVPVYPKHWTVGATELIITGSVGPLNSWPTRSSSSVFSPTFSPGPSVPMTVVATRTVRGVDVPAGWIDVTKLRQMREQWDRKVLRVSDAQTDGKWLVLAAGDVPPSMFSSSASDSDLPHSRSTSSMHSSSTLQLYRLSFSPPSPSIASPPPKLVFIRNLYGQTGPTAALAVADGRCVSLSANGSIWVWDLEGGGSAEVAPPDPARTAEDVQGLIAFDERRIITTGASGVVVRRFDI